MQFDNELTRLLGVTYPIIQGAVGWKGSGTSSIAVPVSEAGGLGILTALAYKNPDEFQDDIRNAMKKTNKPLAVNFTLIKSRQLDVDYYKEYIKIALDEGIRIAFTSAYNGFEIGTKFQEAGGCWIQKCATIRHAVSISKKGADAIVIVGLEGTGFKSPEQNTTMINMTAARQYIDVPLIAAGGIGDARGFIGALAMGASGIYMGTAFMATKEFKVDERLKTRMINQDIMDAEYCKKIYNQKRGVSPSLAVGVIHSVPTVKEFIEDIINDAQKIMEQFKKWGMFIEA